VVGDEFIKLYVCTYYGWNPYSDEMKRMPSFYWIISYSFIQMHRRQEWDHMLKPQAELIGQIANPDVFKQYSDFMKKLEREKSLDKGEVVVSQGSNVSVSAATDSHYDPELGLVDGYGNIIIPKERYDKLIGLGGVAVSY
jgi:hypothetical protein